MMLKTIGAITVFTYAAFLFSAPLLDPVILENEYLKLTVDRQRGATLRSLIDKKRVPFRKILVRGIGGRPACR